MSNISTRLKITLPLLLLMVLIVTVAGLLLVSYSVGLAMLLGIITAAGVLHAARLIRTYVKRSETGTNPESRTVEEHREDQQHGRSRALVSRRVSIGIASFVAIATFLLTIVTSQLMLLEPTMPPSHTIPPDQAIEKVPITLIRYSAAIEPVDEEGIRRFKVQEQAAIRFGSDARVFTFFSTRTVAPAKEGHGFLLREAKFSPMEGAPFKTRVNDMTYDIDITSYLGEVSLKELVTDNKWVGDLCAESCPSSKIELLSFPANSFSEANNKRHLARESYRNTQEITWVVDHLDRPVEFSYVASPYYNVPLIHTLLAPVGTASSYGTAVAFIFGSALMSLVRVATNLVTEQTLLGWWASRLKPWVHKLSRKITNRQAGPAEQKASAEEQERESEARNNTEEPYRGQSDRGSEWL